MRVVVGLTERRGFARDLIGAIGPLSEIDKTAALAAEGARWIVR